MLTNTQQDASCLLTPEFEPVTYSLREQLLLQLNYRNIRLKKIHPRCAPLVIKFGLFSRTYGVETSLNEADFGSNISR